MEAFTKVAVALVAMALVYSNSRGLSSDLLNGFSSEMKVSDWQMQLALMGFCTSPLVGKISKTVEHSATDNTTYEYHFAESGGINEEDYEKGSIYSIFYSLYANLGKIKSGVCDDFEFTFNTWGIAPADYPVSDPQRHGKTSYSYFAKDAEIQQYLQARDGKVQVVEIGCGTGAGANHLSTEIFPNATYMAIDMQRAAVDTCKRLHASERLTCVHIPSGVGNQDGKVPLADSSADFVMIVETHIAEQVIGPEEKAIFNEIIRVLKPGGYFFWGNAMPTDVWWQAEAYLPTVGFETVMQANNTKGAVVARDEDHARCDAVMDAIYEHHHAFKLPVFGQPCWEVVDKLIRNFYRVPGTALYDKMVQGYDSYMHYIFKLTK